MTKRKTKTYKTVSLRTPSGELTGADVKPGQTVVFEALTGRVFKIGRRKIKWEPR